MSRLTAVVSVLADGIATDQSHVDMDIELPPSSVALETFVQLVRELTPLQCGQAYAGVDALRRAFSSQVITRFVLRRVNADILSRTDIGSDDAMLRLKAGGVLVSLVTEPGFEGEGVVGRPAAKSIDESLKTALGEAVARVLGVGSVTETPEEQEVFDTKLNELGERLEEFASLFNLNADHTRHHEYPVRNWCETQGPDLLAAAYGLDLDACEGALCAALKSRIKQRGFKSVLEEEIGRVDTLLAWVNAYFERRAGLSSRRDTIRRTFNKTDTDWESAPGVVSPPRMHNKVRRSIVAEKAMSVLTTRSMLESAVLFDLRPGHDVFLTRLYLLPILAAADFAGRVGLRRQPGEIADSIIAGGLLALAENQLVLASGEPDAEEETDDIAKFQALVRSILVRTGIDVNALAAMAYGHFQTGQPVRVDPPAGPPMFFTWD